MQKLFVLFIFLVMPLFTPGKPAWSQAVFSANASSSAIAAPTTTAVVAKAAQAATSTQNSSEIIKLVSEFLHDMTRRYEGDAQIAVETPRIGNHTACADLQPHLSGRQTLRSRMTVTVRCLAPVPWVMHVQANVSINGLYYVASRTINVGETVGHNDLEYREADLLRLSGDAILEPESAIGFISSQRIPAGTTVKSRMLRDPDSIERGQAVRTEVRGPGFLVTGEGQALEGGAPGARVQVRASSGQIITGVVLNGHTVRIMM
ncbi:flagellar basal body P-ring formation chaperone FlgA [Allopusillimonas ginsengisoli]|uniref:flagellar basal body P-ring formation chaperone FlgA n=1 Tax=Allopusillimonas ginsengisoli TaxID=453575 RepID=UPI0010C1F767|nr:flagellar basal body P-ring formation protein FlgA [Allopusillimonas ginsengisoli]